MSAEVPGPGEVWRNAHRARRLVRDVSRSVVTFSRPADGHRERRTVPLQDWLAWAQETRAVKVQPPEPQGHR